MLDNIEETLVKLHGRRMRLQLELENARLPRFNRLPLEDFMAEVHTDLLHYLMQCRELKDTLKSLKAPGIDYTLGAHLLQWKARRVVSLVEDWKGLKQGNYKFLTVYSDRW